MSDDRKILFISQYAGFIGGLEKYIHSVAGLLKKNGCRVYCLYVEKISGAENFLSVFDGAWNFFDISKISEADFSLTTLHKISSPDVLEKILEKFSPTAFIHDHDYYCPKGYKYYPYGRINCTRGFGRLFCGVCASAVPPRHIKAMGLSNMLAKNFSRSAALYNLVKTCPRFVVLSDFMRRTLLANGFEDSKIKIVHPFLEMPPGFSESLPPAESPYTVFAGQQVMSKGTPLFLESVARTKYLKKAYVLGGGGRLEDFKNLSAEMGLENKVQFMGRVENPNDWFKAANSVSFPSMWQEPFGLSGIEAFACATPVVGFDVGGVSEWLKDRVNGLLVAPRDTDAFARALDALALDAALRKSLSEGALAFARENYSAQQFLKAFSDLL